MDRSSHYAYQGVEANQMNQFRRDILNLRGGVEFVKKRLLVKAAETLASHFS